MKNKIFKILTLILVMSLSFTMFACNSKSAYDIAVDNGFSGTEQEWLDSLKGMDGERGEDGKDNNITIDELYNAAVSHGYTGDFMQFINEYLNSSAEQNNVELASSKALLSAVNVRSEYIGTRGNIYSSLGAGVIYRLDRERGDAYIITNFHVVYDNNSQEIDGISTNISVKVYGALGGEDTWIKASYIGGSMHYDIAVIKVTGSETFKHNLIAVDVADSDHVKVGSTALAVGNPDGGGIAITKGIVSVDSEYITMYGADGKTTIDFRTMRVDTAINHGNSGGGLFNAKGQLLGIVNAKIEKAGVDNIGYVIPSSIAVKVADNIIWGSQNGRTGVFRGVLGITVKATESYARYNKELNMTEIVQTVSVENIEKDSPANGVVKVGDKLIKIGRNGENIDITRMFMVVDYMLTARPGDTIDLTVVRDGSELDLHFKIERENFRTIK